MTRTNYGKVGGRRAGGAVWQWMIIGITLGFACSVVIVLTLLTLGVLNLDDGTSVASSVTNTPFIVTATTDPLQPTITPFIVTATPEPIDESTQAQVVAPTPTDIPPSPEPAAPTATATEQTFQSTSTGQTGTGTTGVEISPLLQGVITDMVTIDGGTFLMGTTSQEIAIAVRECQEDGGGLCTPEDASDSLPAHSVTLDSFMIERTEVTNSQYVAFLNSMGPGSHLTGCFNQRCVETEREAPATSVVRFDSQNYAVPEILGSLPIVGVSWWGARAYCEAIGRRLPTEAEWERAARGPDNTIYPWGDVWNNDLARTNRPDPSRIGAIGVGSFPASTNAFGALDMAGNVAEWVADFYQANYYSQPAASGLNPPGPPSGTDRVIRGGSWDARPFFARSTQRQHLPPGETRLWLGFRCASDIDSGALVPGAVINQSGLPPVSEESQTPLGAAPTLPPRPTAFPTEAPAVPPGG